MVPPYLYFSSSYYSCWTFSKFIYEKLKKLFNFCISQVILLSLSK